MARTRKATIATGNGAESRSLILKFRVSPDQLRRLKAGGQKYGMSAALYARQLALDTLDDVTRARMEAEIEALRGEVRELAASLKDVREAVIDLEDEVFPNAKR
jgi:hypothetical protein